MANSSVMDGYMINLSGNPDKIWVNQTVMPIELTSTYKGRVSSDDGGGFTALPVHTFLAFYSTCRKPMMESMQDDFDSIIQKLNFCRTEGSATRALSSAQLERIERAVQRKFNRRSRSTGQLINLDQMIITNRSIKKLFPALIPDSPFTASKNLNRSLLALPFQITELFLRTIIDCVASLALSAYGFVDADMAEYYKARLSITHNNAYRAIIGNIFSNIVGS
jgi:hypothetical protein